MSKIEQISLPEKDLIAPPRKPEASDSATAPGSLTETLAEVKTFAEHVGGLEKLRDLVNLLIPLNK
jgi:hypothetical protein